MKLRDYLYFGRISQTDFSNQIGISKVHLCCYLNGKTRLSLPTAKKIEEVTNMEVTVEDIFKDNPKIKTRLCPHCKNDIRLPPKG